MNKPSHSFVATVLAEGFQSAVGLAQKPLDRLDTADNAWQPHYDEIEKLIASLPEHTDDLQLMRDAGAEIASRPLTSTLSAAKIEQYFQAAGNVLSQLTPQEHLILE